MTGIKRLRSLASVWYEWGLGWVLADIADEIERERDAEVADSPYDAILPEDRDALAWVREHGGIDHVKREWRSRVPHERYEAKRQRLLGHIAECETALGRRRRRIEDLGHRVSDLTNENSELRRRAMPEGIEWPCYESGELVQIGAMFAEKGTIDNVVASVELSDDWFAVHGFDGAIDKYSKGKRVKRPAPAVLAADGEPLEVGQTVWDTDAESDTPLTVVEVSSDLVRCEYTWKDGKTYRPCYPPDQLTHTKPEPPDSWECIEDDARGLDSGVDRELFTHTHEDIVRRCRALAERERCE